MSMVEMPHTCKHCGCESKRELLVACEYEEGYAGLSAKEYYKAVGYIVMSDKYCHECGKRDDPDFYP